MHPLSQKKGREVDRAQWADVQRLLYEFQANGRGEYLFEEPIYFGTAFASPPTLSYSSITDGFLGEPVIPFNTTPPSNYLKNVDPNGLGNHSLGTNNTILDPGFEIQGQFIPLMGDDARYIPVTSDLPNAWTPRWYDRPADEQDWWKNFPNVILGVWDRDGHTDYGDYGNRIPGFANNWMQTDDVRARWIVSNDMAHEYGVGPTGSYSAKVTFTADGSSNWLIPLGWSSNYVDELAADFPSTAHWGVFTLHQWGEVPVSGACAVPPVVPGYEGTAAVWSDQDCELEVWYYTWWTAEGDEGVDPWWDYEPMPLDADVEDSRPLYWSDLYPYQPDTPACYMSSNVRVKVPIQGGSWNDVSYYLRRGRNQWQLPNIPPGSDLQVGGPSWQQDTFRFRINNAVAGQVVHLDNVYVWPDIKNIYVPMVTIGVAEWVVDERGAFIGVKPWVKVGDP